MRSVMVVIALTGACGFVAAARMLAAAKSPPAAYAAATLGVVAAGMFCAPLFIIWIIWLTAP
jgi:hypothetical protein